MNKIRVPAHTTHCRCCLSWLRDDRQPFTRKDASEVYQVYKVAPVQTCLNPDCPMYNETVDHATVDLSKYGATQHPLWSPPLTEK